MRFNFRCRNKRPHFTGLVAVLLLAGCTATTPVQYYQLSALREAVPVVSSNFKVLEFGIGPVTMPAYLERPQIATRISANQLSFSDQYRWAEPLAVNFSRVLAENFSRLFDTDRFQVFPWPRSRSIDLQIVIEILRFENQADGAAVLEVMWKVKRGNGEVILPAMRSHFESPADGPDQDDRVASLSKTVTDLSQEIVARLTSLHGWQL